MAYPWLYFEGFEDGTRGLFDATSATAPTITHYTDLARLGLAPYRGAYALYLPLTTTDRFLTETGSWDFTAGQTRWIRFSLYVGRNLVMADGDRFTMFNLESVADTTEEVACGIDRSGTALRFWIAETSSASAQTSQFGTTAGRGLGQWYTIELRVVLDAGAGNDGTIDLYVDDSGSVASVTALDQAAIVQGKLGVFNVDSGTSGDLVIDDVYVDDAQVFRDREPYPMTAVVETSSAHGTTTTVAGHPLIGPGCVEVSLTGAGTNAVLTLYDSDGAPNRLEPIDVIRNTTANEHVTGRVEYEVHRGLYVQLSGTDARAFVQAKRGGIRSRGALIERGIRQGAPHA